MLTPEIISLIIGRGAMDSLYKTIRIWQEAGCPTREELQKEFDEYHRRIEERSRRLENEERERRDDYDLGVDR